MKISIITVCYNSVKTIEQTIQSVINQSYPKIEYIIIDGGSTDGTIDIVKKYEDKITYWVSEPDHGIYDAMNKGIRLATGDVVGLINSDDWYADDTFGHVGTFFDDNPAVQMIHGDIMLVSSDGRERYLKGIPRQEETLLSWYDHPTVFMRRYVYEKYGLYDLNYPILADVELMLRLRCQKISIANIPKLLAYFRIGGISTDNRHYWRRLRELKRIVDNLKRAGFFGNTADSTIRTALREKRYQMIIRYLLWRMQQNGEWLSFLRQQLTACRKNAYAVWGTGDDAAMITEDFAVGQSLISCFIDSNRAKQGTIFCSRMVKSPTIDLSEQMIIVATRRYAHEVQIMLESKGYRRKLDFLLPDDFYKSIWQRYIAYWRHDSHGNGTHSFGE